jgi:hypothetical protein
MHEAYTSKCVAFIFGFHFWCSSFIFWYSQSYCYLK